MKNFFKKKAVLIAGFPRWNITTVVIALVVILVSLINCTPSETPTQPVTIMPNSNNQSAGLQATDESKATVAPPATIETSLITEPNSLMTEVPMTQKLEEGSGGGIGIRGHVMGKSDVATQPDIPFQALILAIPSDKFGLLLEEAEFTKKNESDFRRLGFNLSKKLFIKYVVHSVISQQNGEYEFQLPPGNYLLCLANLDLATRSEPLPAYIQGCIEVTVSQGEQLTQDIYWGIAGVTPR